jgi:ribonuclease P protein component
MQRPLRLRQSEHFARLRSVGRVQRHAWLTLSYAPNDLPHNRYGFITAKAIGKAVVRNRTRRRLRALMRQLHPRLLAGYDVICVARSAFLATQGYSDVQRVLVGLCQRARLFNDV